MAILCHPDKVAAGLRGDAGVAMSRLSGARDGALSKSRETAPPPQRLRVVARSATSLDLAWDGAGPFELQWRPASAQNWLGTRLHGQRAARRTSRAAFHTHSPRPRRGGVGVVARRRRHDAAARWRRAAARGAERVDAKRAAAAARARPRAGRPRAASSRSGAPGGDEGAGGRAPRRRRRPARRLQERGGFRSGRTRCRSGAAGRACRTRRHREPPAPPVRAGPTNPSGCTVRRGVPPKSLRRVCWRGRNKPPKMRAVDARPPQVAEAGEAAPRAAPVTPPEGHRDQAAQEEDDDRFAHEPPFATSPPRKRPPRAEAPPVVTPPATPPEPEDDKPDDSRPFSHAAEPDAAGRTRTKL